MPRGRPAQRIARVTASQARRFESADALRRFRLAAAMFPLGRDAFAPGLRRNRYLRIARLACGEAIARRSWVVVIDMPNAPAADLGLLALFLARTPDGWRAWQGWFPNSTEQGFFPGCVRTPVRARLLRCAAATVEDRRGPCAAHVGARRAEWAREWTPSGDLQSTRPAASHPRARAAKDVTMRTKTTALALASTLLAAPAAAALAAEADDPPSPDRAALHAPVAGHLTVGAQMRAAHRADDRRMNCHAGPAARAQTRRRHLAEGRAAPPERLRRRRDPRPHPGAAASAERAHRLARDGGDRRLRIGRQPGDRHRQRVLREVPVHVRDLERRRRLGQPGRRAPRPSRTAARRCSTRGRARRPGRSADARRRASAALQQRARCSHQRARGAHDQLAVLCVEELEATFRIGTDVAQVAGDESLGVMRTDDDDVPLAGEAFVRVERRPVDAGALAPWASRRRTPATNASPAARRVKRSRVVGRKRADGLERAEDHRRLDGLRCALLDRDRQLNERGLGCDPRPRPGQCDRRGRRSRDRPRVDDQASARTAGSALG